MNGTRMTIYMTSSPSQISVASFLAEQLVNKKSCEVMVMVNINANRSGT